MRRVLPDVEASLEDLEPAFAVLRAVADACTAHTPARFDLSDLDVESMKLISDTLGDGEVAAKVRGVPAIAVQESVFAGVWRLNGAGINALEVGPISASRDQKSVRAGKAGTAGRDTAWAGRDQCAGAAGRTSRQVG